LVIQQGENLSLLNLNKLEKNLEILMNEITIFFNLKRSSIEQYSSLNSIINVDNLGAIPEFLNYLLSVLGSFTIGLFSVTFTSFFLLKDSHILENAILVFVDDKSEGRLKKSFEKIKNLLSRYFLGLLLQIIILLFIYSIVLLIFGIKNAIVIAFLCALLNLIPYIGPLIGAVLMMFLTMTSNLEADFSLVILPKTIYVMIGFFIGQLIDNFLSQPMIFSKSVKSLEIPLLFALLYLFLGARSGRSDERSVLDSTRFVRGLARMTSTDLVVNLTNLLKLQLFIKKTMCLKKNSKLVLKLLELLKPYLLLRSSQRPLVKFYILGLKLATL
jgi:predicted PurR-regulated permease PerM